MRYRLSDGCVGIALGGLTLAEVAARIIEADAAAAEHLAPHGIVPLDDQSVGGPSGERPPKKRTKP